MVAPFYKLYLDQHQFKWLIVSYYTKVLAHTTNSCLCNITKINQVLSC